MSCPLSEPWGQGHSLPLCLKFQCPRGAAACLQGLISAATPAGASPSSLAPGPSAGHAPGHLLGSCLGVGSFSPRSPVAPARTQIPRDQPREPSWAPLLGFLVVQCLLTFCPVCLFTSSVYLPGTHEVGEIAGPSEFL